MKPTVTLGDAWNAELDAFLAARIYEFNASATGHADGRALTATVDDARGRRIAAASGHTWEAPASSRRSGSRNRIVAPGSAAPCFAPSRTRRAAVVARKSSC